MREKNDDDDGVTFISTECKYTYYMIAVMIYTGVSTE